MILIWRVPTGRSKAKTKQKQRIDKMQIKWDSDGSWNFWCVFNTAVTSTNYSSSSEFLHGLSAHRIQSSWAMQYLGRAHLEVPFQGFDIPNAFIDITGVTPPECLDLLQNSPRRQERLFLELEGPIANPNENTLRSTSLYDFIKGH